MKDYVKCNNCEKVYKDNGKIYYSGIDTLVRMNFIDSQSKQVERNDCCPICKTDEYLMDLK